MAEEAQSSPVEAVAPSAESGSVAPAAAGTPAKNSDEDLAALAAAYGVSPAKGNAAPGPDIIAQKLLSNGNSDPPVLPIERTKDDIDAKNAPGDGEGDEEDEENEVEDDAPEWVQYIDEESGCPYWYNIHTGETTWEEPTEEFGIDESAAEVIEKDTSTPSQKVNGVREGFICPRCMLDCGSQIQLVEHSKVCTAAVGPQTKAPVAKIQAQGRASTMAERLMGYFTAPKDDSIDMKDMLVEAGSGGGQEVHLTEKQLRKLIGLNKKNKMLKAKLTKQTEKYNQNIKVLVERDRKYKLMLQKQEEKHMKEVHTLKEQNARLARGMAQQHEEFKRKNLKVLKQNQSMGKQLSGALLELQGKSQLETDNKALREENFKLRQYIKRVQRELLETKNIATTLKDATRDAHKKIYELESKKQLEQANVSLPDTDFMPVATLPVEEEQPTASV
eukprot:CAMPEP_0114509360 /NCGR_PEP_ID=MMETSP0109-20121206/13166_1 /TAXON_ID=29199 /ORGANISM="Chlorarachnion reptans, Strain CCCM449" /LENGTH=445 /DNA_ID=CAMNT_0001688503 /DNA_START=85 /DNA_END=1422 /DNA_ORIENTATION=+